MGTSTSWFALQIRPRYEKLTSSALDGKGFENFLPLQTVRRRWSDRVKTSEAPLFPGYVFCRFDVQKRLPILTTPGVTSIIGFGPNPVEVPDEEIASLQAVVKSGLFAAPSPFLATGQKIRIDVGPLFGTEGVVVQVKNSTRLIVSIMLLQRSVSVEIDRLWVSLGAAPARKAVDVASGFTSPSLRTA